MPFPIDLDTSDPVIKKMLLELQKDPKSEKALQHYQNILLNYEPCSRQLHVMVNAYIDAGIDLPSVLQSHVSGIHGAVTFREQSGEVMVGSDCVGSIPPATQMYYFVRLLYKNIGTPIPHEQLSKFIMENMGIRSSSMAAKQFCYKVRSAIKAGHHLSIGIDKLIKSRRTNEGKTGYVLLPVVEKRED